LADDVARLRQVLRLQSGPTVLVGACYGGQIITAIGTSAPDVVGLIYIAGFALDEGESLADVMGASPAMPALERVVTDEQGFGWLAEDDYVHRLAGDVEPEVARAMWAAQQPLAVSAFGVVMGVPAWRSLPCWYLVATEDEAFSPATQHEFAARMGGTTAEVIGGHLAAVSCPAEVTDFVTSALEDAAQPF